jgi:hypothetical protein
MRAASAVRLARHVHSPLRIGGLARQGRLLVGFVLGDVELPRHDDLRRIEAQALLSALRLVDGNALAERCSAGILIEDQVEAARRGAADRGFAAGGNPERRMRLLRRRRLDHDVLELPEAAMMRESLPCREGARHHLDCLVETCLRFRGRDLKTVELAVPITLADAEIETAAGDQIERRRLLGQQHRIMPRQNHHRGAKPQLGRAHGERGQKHQRRRHLIPAGEMMLDQKARREAERLGLDVEV